MQIVCKKMKPLLTLIHDTRRAKSNGKYPVKLRVTFNRKQKYYPTSVDLSEIEWQKIHAPRVSKELNDLKMQAYGVLAKGQQICDDLKLFSFPIFENRLYTVRSSSGNLESLYNSYISQLEKEDRISTAKSYQCSLNSLKEFKPRLNLEDITSDFLKQYEKWLLNKGNSLTTVGIYLRPLRALFNEAISTGIANVEQYPFGKRKYEIPAGRNIKKALTLSDVGKIYRYETTEGSFAERAKDFWLFTYYCNGINMKDIAMLQYKNISGDFIVFTRSKTKRSTRTSGKMISIFLNDEAKRIIEKWGCPDKSPDNLIFPIISADMSAKKQYTTIQQFIKTVNNNMNKIAATLGIDKHVTTYTARHTFSTVLKRSGASIEFIGEALGHSNKKTTESYLDSFEKDTQKEFAKKLLEF